MIRLSGYNRRFLTADLFATLGEPYGCPFGQNDPLPTGTSREGLASASSC